MKIKPVEVACQYCGKKMLLCPSEASRRKFCSPECAIRGRKVPKHYGEQKEDETEQKAATYECFFNVGVCCEKRRCSTCGWNPEVKAKRDEEIRRKYGNHNV